MLSVNSRKITRSEFSKILLIALLDILITAASFFFGLWFRADFIFSQIWPAHLHGYLTAIGPWCAVTVLVLIAFDLYRCIWSFVGTSEAFRVVGAYIALLVIGAVVFPFDGSFMPRSSIIVGFAFSFAGTMLSRFSYRMLGEIRQRLSHMGNPDKLTNVMIIGAGDAGRMLLNEYQNSTYVRDNVVCIIDDNTAKKNKRLYGVPIVGGRDQIVSAAKAYNVKKIIYAIPSGSAATRKEILDICSMTGCEVHLLPGIYQVLNGEVSVEKLRKVDPQDLLGREAVQVDLEQITGYISGKTVLITGGGGSIGSELCRQIAAAGPRQLLILDIYENNAYDIQMELKTSHPELNLKVLIGSVRNEARLEDIMQHYRPELVFHAAAHKHVPLMEDSPNEAIKNNVFGTYKMAKAAARYGVKRFVLISTDKAVNPTNIMGASKRLCEMVVQMMNRKSDTEFVAVRFGNVLGSNGSVVPLFKKQIESGGPVTVTHPDVIRYFMTIPEAVSLVLQAGAYAKGGEIFVLDMGEPVKIDTMARNLIRLSGYEPDVDIMVKYTGLRPGEKLYEELLMKEEGMQETCNQRIHIGRPIEMDDEEFCRQLETLAQLCEGEYPQTKELVAQIVPTYRPEPAGSRV